MLVSGEIILIYRETYFIFFCHSTNTFKETYLKRSLHNFTKNSFVFFLKKING